MEYMPSPRYIPSHVLPSQAAITAARATIRTHLPSQALGHEATASHLHDEIAPGLNNASRSSRYYGFVTGGATPIAALADNLVTKYDQNVQVHLPNETIATNVEHHALNMLCELVELDPAEWTHKTFTTGATGSNIIGLACGREWIVAQAAERNSSNKDVSIARQGLLHACSQAGVESIQILTTVPHSSIRKAASILGLGHSSVIDCGDDTRPYRFDLDKLTSALNTAKTASIIMISACEVNSGMFATSSLEDMQTIRQLADKHGAWIHIDAAMGFMARVLPTSDAAFTTLRACAAGLHLADSITGDGHKLLNVPYDTGFLLSRHLDTGLQVFQNPGAAYLAPAVGGAVAPAGEQSEATIPSPLHIGLENSRRFRALPIYANLLAYGRAGYADMIVRQVTLARKLAAYLYNSPHFDVYAPEFGMSKERVLDNVFMIVLFRARDEEVNEELVKRINGTRRIYCSGTVWEGRRAARVAVSNWMASVEGDWEVVREVLEGVVRGAGGDEISEAGEDEKS